MTNPDTPKITGRFTMHMNMGRNGHLMSYSIYVDGQPTGIVKNRLTRRKGKPNLVNWVAADGSELKQTPMIEQDELITWIMLHRTPPEGTNNAEQG